RRSSLSSFRKNSTAKWASTCSSPCSRNRECSRRVRNDDVEHSSGAGRRDATVNTSRLLEACGLVRAETLGAFEHLLARGFTLAEHRGFTPRVRADRDFGSWTGDLVELGSRSACGLQWTARLPMVKRSRETLRRFVPILHREAAEIVSLIGV